MTKWSSTCGSTSNLCTTRAWYDYSMSCDTSLGCSPSRDGSSHTIDHHPERATGSTASPGGRGVIRERLRSHTFSGGISHWKDTSCKPLVLRPSGKAPCLDPSASHGSSLQLSSEVVIEEVTIDARLQQSALSSLVGRYCTKHCNLCRRYWVEKRAYLWVVMGDEGASTFCPAAARQGAGEVRIARRARV